MLEAIVYGLVHGVTTFLPLSALVHRTVIGTLLGFAPVGPASEAALELGAFLAALIFFGPDWIQMGGNALGLRFGRDPELRRVPAALWMLLCASVPVGVVGFWWTRSGAWFHNPFLAGFLLIAVGLAMGWAESSARRQKTVDHLTFADAMLIGLLQILAVLPGASRMAVTLTAAMLLNFDRAAAVRLSYLLALPVLAGRVVQTMGNLANAGGIPDGGTTPFVSAVIACMLSGSAVIALFSEQIRQGDLRSLVRYRVIFGIMVVALAVLLR